LDTFVTVTFFNAGDKVRLNEGMDCADTQEFIDEFDSHEEMITRQNNMQTCQITLT